MQKKLKQFIEMIQTQGECADEAVLHFVVNLPAALLVKKKRRERRTGVELIVPAHTRI